MGRPDKGIDLTPILLLGASGSGKSSSYAWSKNESLTVVASDRGSTGYPIKGKRVYIKESTAPLNDVLKLMNSGSPLIIDTLDDLIYSAHDRLEEYYREKGVKTKDGKEIPDMVIWQQVQDKVRMLLTNMHDNVLILCRIAEKDRVIRRANETYTFSKGLPTLPPGLIGLSGGKPPIWAYFPTVLSIDDYQLKTCDSIVPIKDPLGLTSIDLRKPPTMTEVKRAGIGEYISWYDAIQSIERDLAW